MSTHASTRVGLGYAPARITGLYTAFALLWIWLSDRALVWLGYIDDHAFLAAAGKGTAFVVITAALLFWLVRREVSAVRRSESLLRAVVEGTTDAIFVKDRDGRHLLVNAAAARFVGRPVAEVLGRDANQLFEAADAEWLTASDCAVMAGGDVVTFEETLTSAGVTRVYQATKAPLRDADGTGIGLVGIFRDITERTRVEAALRESEARFRELSDAIPQIVWTAGPDGAIARVNAKGTEYTGVEEAGLTGWSWERVVHPDDLAHARGEWMRTLGDGSPRPVEMRMRRADGAYRWHICRQRPIRTAAGEVASWVGTNTDIDDLKQAEAAIRDSEAMLRLVLDNIPQAVFWKDRDSRYLGGNRVAARAMGLDGPEAIPGLTDADLAAVDPKQAAFFVLKDREVMEADAPQTGIRETMTTPDGRTIWLETNKVPLHDIDGRVVGVLGMWEDVTDRGRAEAALRETEARLREAQRIARLGSWSWEPATGWVWWSDALFELYGLDRATVRPSFEVFLALVHPDDRAVTYTRVEAMLAGADDFADDLRVVLPDGAILWIHSRARATRDAGGRLVRVEGTDQDITAGRLAQKAIREGEKRLQAAVEVAGLGVIVIDYDSQTADLSPVAAEQFGLSPATTVTRSDLHARFHPDDRAEIEQLAAAALDPAGTRWFTMEHRVIRPDGTTRWLQVRKQVSFADGRPQRAVVVSLDVTDRRLASEALRASEVRYRLLFESNPHPMWVYDVDSLRFLAVNDAAVMAYGYSRDEFLAMTIRNVRPAEDVPRLEEAVARRAPGPIQTNLWRHRRKDGTVFDVEVSSHDLQNGDGRSRLVLALDVTERVRAEDALRASEQRLRLALEAAGAIAFVWDIPADTVTRYFSTEPALPVTADRLGTLAEVRARVHADDRPKFDARLTACLTAGTDYRNGYRVVRPDGTTANLEEYGFIDRAADGSPLRLTGLSIDVTDRVAATEALRASEERLQEAARAAGFGVFEHDHLTNTFFWSARQRDICGLPTDAPVDLDTYLACIHPDDRNAVAAAVRAAHDPTGDGRFDVDHRLVLPTDGRVRWLATRSQTRFSGEGGERRPLRTVGATVDVTQAFEAAEALRTSEARYRQLVDMLPTAIFVHAGDAILYGNPAFQQLVGAEDPDELLGRSPFDIAHPSSHDTLRRWQEEMARTGRAVSGYEKRMMRLDGRAVPVYAVAAPIGGYGRLATLVALTDLTERERAVELLRSVLDSVADAIFTVDEQGVMESANPAAVRQFGYTEGELVGRTLDILMPDPHSGGCEAYIARYLRTGVPRVIGVGREVDCRRRDGTRFPAELTVTEFALGGTRHFTGVLRDITERKRLEEQFRQSQKMEAVGRLAGGVAHDFNNLLTVINGYCELLMTSDLPATDRWRESVAAILDAGERAARLTQQLLAFSRKAILEPKILDLNELVSESAKLLRRLIGEDVILAVVTAPTPVRVKADPGQLEQVIMNLVVNARDAMPTGGRLTLETTTISGKEGDPTRFARLSVSDTGHGMTDEVKEKIFEPFYTTKGVGKGTGLGLAVVHGVITQSGGRMAVESVVGVGTTFRLLLPLAADEATGAEAETTRVATRGAETVLLVEDEDAVRTIARLSLEMQGYTVLEADGGATAVRKAETHPGEIHLLVSDVVMPEMGGRQLIEAVRRHRPGVRVLFMSGYTDDAVLLHGVVEATDAFIQKPFTPLTLARKVREVLDAPAR